jgi:thymidylate synthase ThyX
MRVKTVSIVPPSTAEGELRATPEILASASARYSRSIKGIESILGTVDWSDEDKSLKRIFDFIDYGHASIGGLSGGIPIFIDGCSMWLAAKLFELSPQGDGQESSTRYLDMTKAALPDWERLGYPEEMISELESISKYGLAAYQYEYERLDRIAKERPELIKFPEGAGEKVKERIRKNYALDRARYFLPFAASTNVALVQTARAWVETLQALKAHPMKEAKDAHCMILKELKKYAPRLVKHACDDMAGWKQSVKEELKEGADALYLRPRRDVTTDVHIHQHKIKDLRTSLCPRSSRYDRAGRAARLSTVTATWNNMAVAEIRDLNRHRTGSKSIVYTQRGFYLPPEIDRSLHKEAITRHDNLIHKLANGRYRHLLPQALRLGSKSIYTHQMTLEKFAYTAELRTAAGAHFRYKEHLEEAVNDISNMHGIELDCLELGEGEPE